MKALLLDQGLPRRAAALLRDAGWDAVHVAELGMAAAPDGAILQQAVDDDRAVITLDSDFVTMMALSGGDRPSIVHLRMQGLNLRRAGELLLELLPRIEADMISGSLVSVTPQGVRSRPLPVRR